MNLKWVALLIVLLVFTSCTPVSDMPIADVPPQTSNPSPSFEQEVSDSKQPNTLDPAIWDGTIPTERNLISPSTKTQPWIGHDIAVNSDGMIIDTKTGKMTSICFDPICESEGHLNDECPQHAIERGRYFIISPLESSKGLVLYFEADPVGNKIVRYDQITQTMTVVGAGLSTTGSTWRFDPYTQTIYYMAYRLESPSGMSLCALDAKTGEVRILSDIDEIVYPSYIKNQTLYADSYFASVYAIDLTEDFSNAVKVINLDGTQYRARAIDSGYFYFDLRERTEYSVPQEVLDRYDATFDPKYYLTWHDAIYRIPLNVPDAAPELVVENVSLANFKNGKLLYVKHEAQPVLSYVVNQEEKMYRWDDPNAPIDGELKYVFAWDSGSAGIIDLETMTEEVTFALKRYRFEPAIGLYFDGTGMMCGELLDYDEDTMIAAGSPGPKRYFFSLPLQQGDVVTDEDIIPITLN